LDDRFVVAWCTKSWPQNSEIYYRQFNFDGQCLSDEIQLDFKFGTEKLQGWVLGLSISHIFQSHKIILSCYSSWQTTTLYGKLIDTSGQIPEKDFLINRTAYEPIGAPSIAPLLNGGFVVCYHAQTKKDEYSILFQRFDQNAQYIGDEVRVTTGTMTESKYPVIESTNDGRLIIAWEENNDRLFATDVMCRLYDQNGDALTLPFQVNTFMKNNQKLPSIAYLNNDHFIITWSSERQAGTDYDIYGQLFGMDGTKFDDELLLNQHVPCQQISSKACLINKDKFIICWEAACQDGSDKAVMGKFLPTSPFIHNLQPFQITAPSHDSSCDSTNVTIFWERPTIQPVVYPCELLFTLYYSLDSTFHECGKIETRNTSTTLHELQKGKLYYAKVVAQNIHQSFVWSTNTVAFFVNHAAVGESNPFYYNVDDDCHCEWNTNSGWTFVFDEYNKDLQDEENDNVEPPSSFFLKNAPNPFNSTTMIYYSTP
jgi:hypothetical protein